MTENNHRRPVWDFLDNYVWGPLNLIDRVERLITAARFGDMGVQIAIKRADKDGEHTLAETEKLLKRFHIAVYGRTHDADHMYFHVKKRQASWACYVLGRHGYEIESGPDTHSHASGGARQGDPMPAWDEQEGAARGRSRKRSRPKRTRRSRRR